jgi:hypothetical protein
VHGKGAMCIKRHEPKTVDVNVDQQDSHFQVMPEKLVCKLAFTKPTKQKRTMGEIVRS